MFKAEHIRE